MLYTYLLILVQRVMPNETHGVYENETRTSRF